MPFPIPRPIISGRLFSPLFFSVLVFLTTGMMISGCSIKSDMMKSLSDTIVNNDDLSLVEAGAPAYLLMIDSLIRQEPASQKMLSTAAQLYSAYAELFATDDQQSRKMANKALDYADRALCISNKKACGLKAKPHGEFLSLVATMDRRDLPLLFDLGRAWAGWIMAHQDNFNALADISRIETLMLKVIGLEETYQDGAAYLYLGSLAMLLPPALGGQPDQGRAYFEKAIELAEGKNLMARVMFAQRYARMMFDRELHDRLLTQVIQADPAVPGYTLINTHAQKLARQLLDEADNYF